MIMSSSQDQSFVAQSWCWSQRYNDDALDDTSDDDNSLTAFSLYNTYDDDTAIYFTSIRCVQWWHLQKTTLDDIALNDATLYDATIHQNNTTIYVVAADDFNDASLDNTRDNNAANTTAATSDASFDDVVNYDAAHYDATTTPATKMSPSMMPPAMMPAMMPKMQQSTMLQLMVLH